MVLMVAHSREPCFWPRNFACRRGQVTGRFAKLAHGGVLIQPADGRMLALQQGETKEPYAALEIVSAVVSLARDCSGG
jgi:hypothetical protein